MITTMISKLRRVRLHIYRGHEKACPHRKKGRAYDRCSCTWQVDGTIDGVRCSMSLGTRNRDVALAMVREIELTGEIATDSAPSEPTRLGEACEKFLADGRARGLSAHTLYKFELLLRRLKAFAEGGNLLFVKNLDVDTLRQFRATWPHHGTSANKRLEELRAFCRFCWESGWLTENPARKLKPHNIQSPPREPFTEQEVGQILRSCADRSRTLYGRQLQALVHLLVETGLRIGDAIQLRTENVVNGKLLLRTEKTGTPVCLPLSRLLVEELESIQGTNSHFFWSGRGKLKSRVGNWQRSLKRLFRIATVQGGCAHRFRHNFAKRALLTGIPPERVAMLMGHKSPAVTMKYYSQWVRERQEQLEADVRLLQAKYARYSLGGDELVQ
jgi:integrase